MNENQFIKENERDLIFAFYPISLSYSNNNQTTTRRKKKIFTDRVYRQGAVGGHAGDHSSADAVLVKDESAAFKVDGHADSVARRVTGARRGIGVVVIDLPRRIVRPPVRCVCVCWERERERERRDKRMQGEQRERKRRAEKTNMHTHRHTDIQREREEREHRDEQRSTPQAPHVSIHRAFFFCCCCCCFCVCARRE